MKFRTKLATALLAIAALTIVAAPSAHADDPLVLPAPTQNADCTINTPEVEGVFYGVYDYTSEHYTATPYWDEYGWEAGDDLLVIASYDNWAPFGDDPIAAENPGGIDSAGNPGWWFPNDCDTVIEVTAVAPVFVNPAGPGNMHVVINTFAVGYHYVVSNPQPGKFKVTAVADEGYVLVGQTYWSKYSFDS